MATIGVSEHIYKELNRVAGELRRESGRPVSMDDVLEHLLKTRGLRPSDFAGSWRMSDDEVGNIMKGLSEFWSRSMRERGTSGKKGGSQVRGGKRDSTKIKAPSPGEEVKSLFRKIDENYKGKRRPSEREVLSSIPSNRLSKVAGSRTLTTEQWNRARKILKKVYPAEESGIDPKDPIFDIALGRRKPLTLKLKGAALACSRKASQEVDAAARDED